MALYMNIGYKFTAPSTVSPHGSVILCSAMPMHQLERRRLDTSPHLQERVFDPQLYLAGLDAAESRRHCANLASYPWFGVRNIRAYDSGQQRQSGWRADVERNIAAHWPSNPPTDPTVIASAVQASIDFQVGLGCRYVIIPSPLTTDPATDYQNELAWIDAATNYVGGLNGFDRPLFATVAVSDLCLRHADPLQNAFLDLVADAVSARGLAGVYLVLEQSSEALETRHCGNTRVLRSVLHLIHLFKTNAHMDIAVNFMGAFGLACEAVGASMWADGWYKSLHRLRLADKLAGGRAYPSFWSYPVASDIHLERDFDRLVRSNHLAAIQDVTAASDGLIRAAARGTPVSGVAAWNYRLSNVASASEHYLLSCIAAETQHAASAGRARLDLVENWFGRAERTTALIERALRGNAKTNIRHVAAWRNAVRLYRQDHNV